MVDARGYNKYFEFQLSRFIPPHTYSKLTATCLQLKGGSIHSFEKMNKKTRQNFFQIGDRKLAVVDNTWPL